MATSYKQKYFEHYGIGEQDVILCICGNISVDLHHVIFRSRGGSDDWTNLIPLCRACHDKAHNSTSFNDYLKKLKEL